MDERDKQPDKFKHDDIVQLRIHGVSNTPPTSVLDADEDRLIWVAGDDDTMIFRAKEKDLAETPDGSREIPDPNPAGDQLVRAYSWGNLTHSRNRLAKDLQRALWMIFLPYAFANVAFWSRGRVERSTAGASRSQNWSAFASRLFALSLTVSLSTMTVGVVLDQVIYQWVSADGAPQACECSSSRAAQVGWLQFLRHEGLNGTTRGVALGLVAALALIFALWAVARRSFQYESETMKTNKSRLDDTKVDHPMESKWFWRGNHQVSSLSEVHLTWAIGTITLLGLAPLHDIDRQNWPATWWGLVSVTVALMLYALVLLGRSPAIVERSDDADRYRSPAYVSRMTLAAAALTLALLAIDPTKIPAAALPSGPTGGMPFFDETVVVLCLAQVVLLVGLWLRRTGRVADSNGTDDRAGGAPAVALGGRGPAILAAVGWLVALLYGAVILFYTADYLNGPGNPVGADDWIQLPLALEVTASWVIPLLGLAVFCGLLEYVWLRRETAAELDDVEEDFPKEHASQRGKKRALSVAKARAQHNWLESRAIDRAGKVVSVWLWFSMVVAIGVAVEQFRPTFYTWDEAAGQPTTENKWAAYLNLAEWSARTGARVLLLLGVALALVAVQAYRGGTTRRVLGVVWDVATFWPRACHPWAPPCYAERVVPQLATYIGNRTLEHTPGFILAGHSQGSVISVATLWQLPDEFRDRCALLSYGSQLRAFYGRTFPQYFGPAQLAALAAKLGDNSSTGAPGLRWRSLWRKTDPIGYRIDDPSAAHPALMAVDVDPLLDPSRLKPLPHDYIDTPMRRHSDYPRDREFHNQAEVLATMLRGAM